MVEQLRSNMKRRDWWLGIAVIVGALLAHAAFPRYAIREVGTGRYPYRVDRWTGYIVGRASQPPERDELEDFLKQQH